jgi:sugar/nucleoside kinase (ribokinase family)
MTRRGILTGGSWCLDRNMLVDRWPQLNGRADILDAKLSGGGSGCNMAIDLRKLDPDLPVATITLLGDDADGRHLIELAKAHGIDAAQMRLTDRAATNYTHAYSDRSTGQRTHISYFGAGDWLTPDHFDFSGSAHVYLHLGLPGTHQRMDGPWADEANGWVATLKKARAAGLKTNLELASLPAERLASVVRPCLPHLDLLVVNDHEIGGIAGLTTVKDGITDQDACIAAARAVLALGACDLVAVHFPKGGIVAARDGTVTVRPSVDVPPGEVAGANGAGDAFAAGFLYAQHEGWSVERTLVLAHAVAAASLRAISTTDAVETSSQCLALADRWGWRGSVSPPNTPSRT